jgi:hypothetical protein
MRKEIPVVNRMRRSLCSIKDVVDMPTLISQTWPLASRRQK